MPGHPQHPDQPPGDHPARVVVGDHGVVVADPERGHRGGEGLRHGQRVASGLGRVGMTDERRVEVDEDRAGDVPARVGGAARAPVEVPAAVGEDDLAPVVLDPVDVDERRDHGHGHASCHGAPAARGTRR
ncbi:MAG TPA: hypothetical protein VGH14_03245 [Solirubrobacterales bacterium]